MSFDSLITDMTKQVDRLLSKTANVSHKYAHNIDVQIKRGLVTIDAPKGTLIQVNCWYDSSTRMNMQFMVGDENHAELIRKLTELERKLDFLERANA